MRDGNVVLSLPGGTTRRGTSAAHPDARGIPPGEGAPVPRLGKTCYQGLFSRNLFLGQRIPLAGVAHQNGTIRFGRDPQDLGAGRELPARTRVDNLYVVDGSFVPSSAAVKNPALTIIANAFRVGDRLKARLG